MSPVLSRRAALALTLQALVARSVHARVGPVPFNVGRKPMPTSEAPADLLPARVGEFRRDALPSSTAKVPSDEELYVTYRRGPDSVSVGVSLPGSADDARAAVETAATETRDELRRTGRRDELPRLMQDLKGDPAFVAASDFMAWTRGRYFFAAKANNPRALAGFMQAFPY
ncbi:MAG TPA: hypothetical protein VMF13_14200 [Luteitalea sp.]|nr:hypothetical protein [Luteitalea sp.]